MSRWRACVHWWHMTRSWRQSWRRVSSRRRIARSWRELTKWRMWHCSKACEAHFKQYTYDSGFRRAGGSCSSRSTASQTRTRTLDCGTGPGEPSPLLAARCVLHTGQVCRLCCVGRGLKPLRLSSLQRQSNLPAGPDGGGGMFAIV